MPKLSNNEVGNHLSEDHICQGCDRDTLDCICMESYEDLYHYEPDDREYLEPIDESFNMLDPRDI